MEEPRLRVAEHLKSPPGAKDTSLRLEATDVDACDGGDHEVVDVTVAETEAEIIVGAGVRIDNQPFCEVRTATDVFAVELDRALGRRLVIDNSKGQRSVIWSPRTRRDVLRRLQVESSEAEAFLRSKFPAGEDPDCSGSRRATFNCTLRASPRGKRVDFYVQVLPGGELKALTGELAAVRAKKALTRRP